MSERTLQLSIQLDQFALTDFSFRVVGTGEASPGKPGQISIAYGFDQVEAPAPRRIVLSVEHLFSHPDGTLLHARATIVGFFKVPPDTTEKQALHLLKIHGLSMLYGSLRGLLLSFSGAFPPGVRCILPTVNMIKVVSDAEKRGPAISEAPANYEAPPPPKMKKPSLKRPKR